MAENKTKETTVDPRDFIKQIDNEEKRKAMGAFGRRRVMEELEWRHEVPKLLAAYEALRAPSRAAPVAQRY